MPTALHPSAPSRARRTSLGKVMRSPPASIFKLLAFTASVALAVARLRLAELWQGVWQRMAALFGRGGGSSEAAAAAAPVPA